MLGNRPARPLALRVLALASTLALLFAGSADAYGLHRCAHHDGVAPPAAAAAADHTTHVGHAAGGHPADPAADDAGEHQAGGHLAAASHGHADGPAEHGDACSCVGECAGAAATLPTREPLTVAAGAISTYVAAPAGLPAIRQIDWLLPPGNGPPALT